MHCNCLSWEEEKATDGNFVSSITKPYERRGKYCSLRMLREAPTCSESDTSRVTGPALARQSLELS